MQIKTTNEIHLTVLRMATIQVNKKLASTGMWRKPNPCALTGGLRTGAAPAENSTESPQKIKNRQSIPPSNST